MKSNPFLLVTCLFSFLGCTDEMDGLFPDPLHPNQKTFKSSLFIEVKNTEGKPVYNALVQIGNIKGETNTEGFLYLENALVTESSYITVEKEGFFHASRRFYPSENKSQFIELILLSNSQDAFFTSSVGQTFSFNGGITLTFPKDGYEYKGGASYTGVVIVAEQSIPANDPDLSFKMPGDLTGIDKEGDKQALGSMGMMAVELRSASGELLKLKKDATVDVQIKVPSEMLGTAPSTLPMWYFDEQNGTWREEGEASLAGDIYTTTVHHFSFWNCDAGFPTIKWEATFMRSDDSPASQVQVCITIKDLNTIRCDYTNENGWIAGQVASGKLLSLNVIAPECNESIYSAEIGPFAEDVVQGSLVISPPILKESKINGIAVNCDKNPVLDGYVVINVGTQPYCQILDKETGTFSTTVFNCNESEVSLFAIDNEKANYSPTQLFSYAPSINVDTIVVCKNLDEYVIIEIDGFPDPFTFAYPGFWESEDEYSLLYAGNDSLPNRLGVRFIGKTVGTYHSTEGSYIHLTLGIESIASGQEIKIVGTQLGEVGELVKGNLSGDLYTDPGNSNPTHTFSGNFSVLRR